MSRSHLFRTIILILLLVATGYFAIHWIGTAYGEDFIYRPSWIKPNTEEPLTIICGIISALVGIWERVIAVVSNRPKDTVFVSVLNAKANHIKNFKPGFKEIVISNGMELQFHIENLGERVAAIKFMSVFKKTVSGTIFFSFERIFQIRPGYPKGVSVDPRPDLIEKIEPKTSKTVKVSFSCHDFDYSLKDELVNADLTLQLIFIDGKRHVAEFRLRKWGKD